MGKLEFASGATTQDRVLHAITARARTGSARLLFAAAVFFSMLCCSVAARADVFAWVDGRGMVDAALDVTDPASTKKVVTCRLPAETRFRLAPDPDSAASAPTRLLWVTKPAQAAASGAQSAVTDLDSIKVCDRQGYGYQAKVPEIDSRTYYAEATIGAAVIPFKYYMGGDKSVKSNTTALGYIGLKRHTPGGDYIFGVGAGPSQISVAAPSTGTGASAQGDSTQAGFTVAIVMLGQLKYDSPAQFGLAIGQDRTSKSANWQNNGKWWLGFQVGMSIF